MTKLYAQPYDVSATGFYFDNAEEYTSKVKSLKNDYGDPVEEFEIQFIDGEDIDCAFANALGLNQLNHARYIELVDEWEEPQKILFIIAVGECGYDFDIQKDDPDNFNFDYYQLDTMRELAEMFVEDGLFGAVPKRFETYIDYNAIARDLAIDYVQTDIAGQHFIYRCE